MAGEFKDFASQLGLSDLTDWTVVNAKKIPLLDYHKQRHLIVHYDLYMQELKEDGGFRFIDELFGISKSAKVVTLYTSPNLLKRRIFKRFVWALFSASVNIIRPGLAWKYAGAAYINVVKLILYWRHRSEDLYAAWDLEISSRSDLQRFMLRDGEWQSVPNEDKKPDILTVASA